MFRKEVNERSPMRVFEQSMHGGLGRGNLGVVVAKHGVGKTPLLVQIALDDLMRDRKVLHICHEHTVEHVRAHYDEVFHDLAISHGLAQPQMTRLEIERNRLIYSHLDTLSAGPQSLRGGASSISRIRKTLEFSKEYAHFAPDAVIIDGFDFENASREAFVELAKLAKELNAEIWLSANLDDCGPTAAAEPRKLGVQFSDEVAVVVFLQPDADHVRIQLLKDHDNPQINDVHLCLDPGTLSVVGDGLPEQAPKSKDPSRFHLYSGGAKGAESAFGICAERWGMSETHFSFEGHPFLEREQSVQILSEDELRKGDFSLVYASHRLGRRLSEIPNIKRILQTVWHQITAAGEVFVVGSLQEDGTVRGGTGWGAELARLWGKPICVFDQQKGAWFRWDATRWTKTDEPVIQRSNFAGMGTTRLTQEGTNAIEALFLRSFGPAPSAS